MLKMNPKFKDVISKEKLELLLESVSVIAYRNTIKFQEYFPDAKAEDGIYYYSDTFFDSWHGGWWTGIFYMLYNVMKDDRMLHYAENYSARFYSFIKNNRIVHREMGFMYLPICVYDIVLNRNAEAVEAVILAARYMNESYNVVGEFETERGIRSNLTKDKIKFAAASAVNSKVLSLAAKLSANTEFEKTSVCFAEDCFKYNITPQGRCYMNVFYDTLSEEIIHANDDTTAYGLTGNGGYMRAYAWISLGLAINCTNEIDIQKYEPLFYKIINYVLAHSDGNLNVLSFSSDRGRQIIDSTSLAIIVCAFAEILKKIDSDHEHYKFYYSLFDKWFNKMTEYAIDSSLGKQGFLDKGVLLGGYDLDGKKIKNSCNICGDYFYLEALMHMVDGFESCWNIDRLFER